MTTKTQLFFVCILQIAHANFKVANENSNSILYEYGSFYKLIRNANTIITYGVAPYNGTVATNDNDPNGNLNPNGFSMVTLPIYGDIIFNNDGSFTYTAYNGFIGEDYLFYEVCDTGNPVMCSYATLNIIVPDSAPVTINNTVFATEDLTVAKLVFDPQFRVIGHRQHRVRGRFEL